MDVDIGSEHFYGNAWPIPRFNAYRFQCFIAKSPFLVVVVVTLLMICIVLEIEMINFLHKESTAVPSTDEPIRYAQLYVIDHNFRTISYNKKYNNNLGINEKSK